MRATHVVVGFSIVGGFALLWLWGLGAWIARRGPGRPFWWLVASLQVALLVQLVAGVALLIGGGDRGVLHYLYGVGFPALVLGAAHWLAREAFAERPWVPFALAGFVAFGLTLRALMTGLGVG